MPTEDAPALFDLPAGRPRLRTKRYGSNDAAEIAQRWWKAGADAKQLEFPIGTKVAKREPASTFLVSPEHPTRATPDGAFVIMKLDQSRLPKSDRSRKRVWVVVLACTGHIMDGMDTRRPIGKLKMANIRASAIATTKVDGKPIDFFDPKIAEIVLRRDVIIAINKEVDLSVNKTTIRDLEGPEEKSTAPQLPPSPESNFTSNEDVRAYYEGGDAEQRSLVGILGQSGKKLTYAGHDDLVIVQHATNDYEIVRGKTAEPLASSDPALGRFTTSVRAAIFAQDLTADSLLPGNSEAILRLRATFDSKQKRDRRSGLSEAQIAVAALDGTHNSTNISTSTQSLLAGGRVDGRSETLRSDLQRGELIEFQADSRSLPRVLRVKDHGVVTVRGYVGVHRSSSGMGVALIDVKVTNNSNQVLCNGGVSFHPIKVPDKVFVFPNDRRLALVPSWKPAAQLRSGDGFAIDPRSPGGSQVLGRFFIVRDSQVSDPEQVDLNVYDALPERDKSVRLSPDTQVWAIDAAEMPKAFKHTFLENGPPDLNVENAFFDS